MSITRKVGNLGLVSLVLCSAMTGRLNAQDSPPLDCSNPTTQTDMTICAGRSAKASDRQLNIAYKQVQQHYRSNDSQTSRDRLNDLTTAQLAWIKYRDTTCNWKASKFSGGSIAPMIYVGCLDRLTQQRTQDLLDDLEE